MGKNMEGKPKESDWKTFRKMVPELPVIIVNADMEITIEAAGLKSTHSVAYADCFTAALGIRKKAKVITGDPEFKRFGEKVKVEWL